MKKVLLVGSMASMLANFNKNNLEILLQLGCEVDVVANFSYEDPISTEKKRKFTDFLDENYISYYQVPFPRGIGNFKRNLKILSQLNRIFKEKSYDLIHTNSPLASVLVRVVAKKFKIPVLYTVHGFQFYQGAAKKDWLIFYSVERLLSTLTTAVITINQEDYMRAQRLGYRNVIYIPGVGINLSKFNNSLEQNSRNKDSKYIVTSVGELNNNKNQLCVLKAIKKSKIKDQLQYMICGVGENHEIYKDFIEKNNLENNVTLLGYREDIKDILSNSDAFVFPSFREGLSVSVMEAMACGKPVFASNIRGNVDLIDQGKGGELFDPNDSVMLSKLFDNVLPNSSLLSQYGIYNKKKIIQFSQNNVDEKMEKVYEKLLF